MLYGYHTLPSGIPCPDLKPVLSLRRITSYNVCYTKLLRKNPAAYEQWYQTPHTHAHLLKDAVYGLPELHRTEIAKAKLVAAPGCYPTAAILQLAPLV